MQIRICLRDASLFEARAGNPFVSWYQVLPRRMSLIFAPAFTASPMTPCLGSTSSKSTSLFLSSRDPYEHPFSSFHYHILSGEPVFQARIVEDTNLLEGLLLAGDIYRPKFSATSPYIVGTIRNDERFLWIGAGIWAFAELSNLHTHLTVRALRPAGSRKRGIPNGYGFNLVSFPNYFFESLAWGTICVMTGSIGGEYLSALIEISFSQHLA